MLAIPGYQLTAKLGEGPQSVVYRGYEAAAPDRPLAIKVFKTPSFSAQQRARIQQKVEHLRVLRDPRFLTPEAFDVAGGVPFVVQDYFEALPLDEWACRQSDLGLDAFFAIAYQLASTLDAVHEAGIIHGGIKPRNILVQPATLEARLTGFVTALDVRDVSHFIFDPAFVGGTLAYTSPEQTGRIHHVVVFASDLYSLGIVFYELLTGRLPFRSTDPLSLIHQHLAEEAPPVHEVNPEVPAALGRIVAKLTLKQPEKRYQSGRGLAADLIRCRTEWEGGRTISRFPLATQDRSRRVVFVSKMVGRDAEARAVLDAYEPVTQGTFRSVLISGLPGIGKTRLIQELQQPIVRHRGYFTSGKFDIYQKNIPYSSLIQALRTLVRTFLTEGQERIEAWRARILEAVGQSGQLLVDVIPELEALLGPQPAVAPLPPAEARNRFHGLFGRFLGCLASADSPLCLFIDDLQWCDVASFDFLKTVFAHPADHPYLFLLGAYRHNEVDSSHPLARLIAEARAAGAPLSEIRLRPLEPGHCHEMVSYILDAPLAHTEALAAFLADLTEGNPLFVSESLSYLYNADLLYVDDDLQWRWDLERIRRSNMPSTVVALFSAKISRLPRPAVELLETAACMGNTVSPRDLARVSERALLDVFETLKPALGQGLVIENRGNLQFIHDRVQEAVLTAIPDARRREIHWRVGHRLLAAVPEGTDLKALDDLFAIVTHLNLGRPEQLGLDEAWRLADLNSHAGEKALDALATSAAADFFATSRKLLPADCWETRYERTFEIFKKAAKTELMCGRPEPSEALLSDLLGHARTDLDKAEALAEQTTSLSSIGNFIKAIETANRGLAYFGKSLPQAPEEAERRRAELMAEIRAAHPDVWGEILEMPFTTDRRDKIELAFYSELIPDLYMSGLVPQLYLSAVQSTQHCLAGGMDESVIYSFSIMGLQLGEQGEFEQAFRYEDLARELSARHPSTFGATRGMNGIVWCNMHSRSRPEEIVEYCLRGIQCGKSCGDLYNAGLCYGPLMWNLQVRGADLAVIEEYALECQRFSERNNLAFSVGLAEAMQAGWIAPMKKGYEPAPMAERVARWEKDDHIATAGSYYAHLALSHYYLGEHEAAAEALAAVGRYLRGLTDNVLKRQWYVFRALNALALHERAGGADHEAVLAEIEPFVEKVETWAALGPLLQPYLAFLRAERERVTGQLDRARGLFLEAIDAAHDQGYTFLEAHLNECLGELHVARGRGPSRPYLAEAARLYRRCKAERKELRLLGRHPELAEAEEAPRAPAADDGEPSTPSPYALPKLDVGYLMRSALAISAEIEEEALLRRIMQTVLESSGAQRGYLLIADGDHVRVRAERHAGGERAQVVGHRLEEAPDVCAAAVRSVLRTGCRLVLADACSEGELRDDPQVRQLGLRSLLCLPVVKQARLLGVLCLDNRLAPAMFTPAAVQTTELLAAQAAISLENARLVEEMRQADEALAREREQLAVTLQSIGDAVIATDTEARVVMLNGVAEQLTGWTQAEAEGRALAEVFCIVNEETGEPAESPVRKVLELGTVVGLANHTALIMRDGRRLSIADSAAPIRGRGGEVLGVVLVFRDVTEERQAELALHEAKVAAEAANVAKSQFLANMSHELRTPMNAILGMTELALEEDLTPTVRDMLGTANDSARSLLSLLDEILDLSRVEAGGMDLERALLSLRELIDRSTKPLLLRAAQKGLSLEIEVPDEVPDQLVGDPLRLRQVFTNLVSNAVKFTPRGRVVVGAAVAERTATEVTLELSISDTGIGIEEADQARIFEPFNQADASTTRRYGGSGLGLPIAKKLVELMGGRIWVESRRGEGSTFRFTTRFGLPPARGLAASAPMPPRSAGARALTDPRRFRPLQVLVVEDTPANQKMASYVLTRRGHAVEVVEDGRQALEAVHRSAYDVVLMDVQMPVMDGFEATAAIRALDDPVKARVPIIAMTAHALKGDEERCIEAGMDAYVSKPIDGHELIQLVERLGGGAALEAPCSGLTASPPLPTGASEGEARFDECPVFDHGEAVRACFGREDMLRQMVECFFEEADPLLGRMSAALERGDAPELAGLAHRLKGTVVYLGARPATEAVRRMEAIGRSGDLAGAGAAFAGLGRELERLKLALARRAAPTGRA